jgi:hypothetical protein
MAKEERQILKERQTIVEEKKTAKEEPQASVSATELARAFVEALQQNTATRSQISAVAFGTPVQNAITEYQEIAEDLVTLDLSR